MKTAEKGTQGLRCGQESDGGKRHIVVDTAGLLPAVVAHPADVQDRDASWLVQQEPGEGFSVAADLG